MMVMIDGIHSNVKCGDEDDSGDVVIEMISKKKNS